MNMLNTYNFSTSPISQPARKLRRLENPILRTLRTQRFNEVYNRRNLNKRITGKSEVKELDAETGLYYYGARYLDPRTSRWLSGDPAMGEYVPAPGQDPSKLGGMGGVYNIINLHTYHYAGNNPIKLIDPDGRWANDVHYKKTLEWGINVGVRPNYAEIIARANNAVDSGELGPATRRGNRLHFNGNNTPFLFALGISSSGGPEDTRRQFFEDCFSHAVSFINNGRIEQGLEIFGRGLHSLQDMYAHTDEYIGYIDLGPFGGYWSHINIMNIGYPPIPVIAGRADNTGEDPIRLINTERETKAAFERLRNAIDEDKRNIIFTE